MKIQSVILAGLIAVAGMVGLAVPEQAMAVQCPLGSLRENQNVSSIAECNIEPESDTGSLMKTVTTIINVVLGVVGIAAVIMIVIGGISFVTSQGDTSKVAKARNTILYGIVGLVVAILAFAIVNFVLSGVFGTKG